MYIDPLIHGHGRYLRPEVLVWQSMQRTRPTGRWHSEYISGSNSAEHPGIPRRPTGSEPVQCNPQCALLPSVLIWTLLKPLNPFEPHVSVKHSNTCRYHV
jgi:hypothetical protein